MPNRLKPKECPFTFGGRLATAEQVRSNGCPYDAHVGGTEGLLDPTTSQPFIDCPKDAAACLARFGHVRYFGGLNLNPPGVIDRDRPTGVTQSKGSESTRNKAHTWIAGSKYFRGSDVLLIGTVGTPSQTYYRTLWNVSEGPNLQIYGVKVNGATVGLEHVNIRLGERGQAPTVYAGLNDTLSKTSTILTVSGPFNGSTPFTPQSIEFGVHGFKDVAVYTNETTHTRIWTNDRVWWLMEMYTNQTTGLGADASRFWIEDFFMPASAWGRKTTTFTNTYPDGEEYTYIYRRTTFDAAMEGRPAVEQILNVCRSGRLSVPFQYEGKYALVPFAVFTEDELTNAPVFYDSGSNLNIDFAEDADPVMFDRIPDDKLTNEITLTFEEINNFDIPRPIVGDDPDQKAKASKLLGEESLQTVQAQFAAFGVRLLPEAVKLLYHLLRFGEFESGGTQNNCTATFYTAFHRTLNMRRYGPLKLVLTTMDIPKDPNGNPFEYFRIRNIQKLPDGRAEVTVQAYNQTAMEAFETESVDPPVEIVNPTTGVNGSGGGGGGVICDPPILADFNQPNGKIEIIVPVC